MLTSPKTLIEYKIEAMVNITMDIAKQCRNLVVAFEIIVKSTISNFSVKACVITTLTSLPNFMHLMYLFVRLNK